MIRAAIIGLGGWGRTLVGSVQGKSEDIHFVAGHARTGATAEPICRTFGIDYLPRFEDVLARKDIDAIVLATPHSTHADQVIAAAAAGKHVFCEKPFTLDLASARRAVEAAERAGIVLGIGFNRRFHPSFIKLDGMAREGALGIIGTIVAELTTPGALFTTAGWRADPNEVPAGAMTGLGIHLLDAMIAIAGPVREVHCISGRRVSKVVDDTTQVLLAFESGICGLLHCSQASAAGFRLTVTGAKGIAEILGVRLSDFRFVPAPIAPGMAPAPPEAHSTPDFDTTHAELVAFARAVSGDATYPVPIDHVLSGVAAFEAIVSSAVSGRSVMCGGW